MSMCYFYRDNGYKFAILFYKCIDLEGEMHYWATTAARNETEIVFSFSFLSI